MRLPSKTVHGPRRVAALAEVPMQGLDANPEAAVPGTHCGFAVLGSSSGVRQFDLTGFALSTPNPRVVLCQPRQSLNSNLNCADLFWVQVISTSRTAIRIVVGGAARRGVGPAAAHGRDGGGVGLRAARKGLGARV